LEGRGRLNVRPSGTESIVRIMAEGPDLDEINAVVHHIADAVRAQVGA
jgi:phosphoglucosamine mutase